MAEGVRAGMGTEILALGDAAPLRDSQTTVAQLRQIVQQFVDQRHWQVYHAPKNLAMSLAIEAAELMEHFQWLTVEESRRVADEPQRREAIAEELADVFCYILAMANALGIDLSAAVEHKMDKNALKYPAP